MESVRGWPTYGTGVAEWLPVGESVGRRPSNAEAAASRLLPPILLALVVCLRKSRVDQLADDAAGGPHIN